MYSRVVLSCTLAGALAGLSGCTDVISSSQISADSAVRSRENATQVVGGEDPHRPDEGMSRKLARQIHGFGGFSYDSLGNIHVFLKDHRDERALAAAGHALNPLLSDWSTSARMRHSANAKVLVHQAQFTFDELRSWRDRLTDPLLTLDGVTFVDLDEPRNRLTIGLDPMQASVARSQVMSILGGMRVPEEAVALELFSPFVVKPVMCVPEDPACEEPCSVDSVDPSCTDPCAVNPDDPSCTPDPCTADSTDPACVPNDPCAINPGDPACSITPGDTSYSIVMPPDGYYGGARTLRERIRPVKGGTEIWYEFRDKDGANRVGVCSMGFAAKAYGSIPVWVTASHCTGLIGVSQNISFFQGPFEFGKAGLYVGYEYADPGFGSNNGYTQKTLFGSCWDRVKCRRSDIALIRAANTSDWQLNYIARPDYGVTGYGIKGSTFLSERYPPLRINLELGAPRLYSQVDKIGRSSGWTYGTVTKTCLDTRYVGLSYDPNPTNIVIRCQSYVDGAHAEGGDSGSPVFILKSGSLVTLLGILWAANNQGFVFSSLDLIRLDLGYATGDRSSFQTYR